MLKMKKINKMIGWSFMMSLKKISRIFAYVGFKWNRLDDSSLVNVKHEKQLEGSFTFFHNEE